jgi:hypothetical protein
MATARVHAYLVPTIVHVVNGKVLDTEVTSEWSGNQLIAVATSTAKTTRHACVRDSGGIVVGESKRTRKTRHPG